MKNKILLNKRVWLNPVGHSNSGALAAKVVVSGYMIDASVSIWDCSRKIVLDFDCYKHADVTVTAKKLDLLISSLEELRIAMGKAHTIATDKQIFDKSFLTEDDD